MTTFRDFPTALQASSWPGVFVFVGFDPNTDFLEDSEVRLDSRGFVVTGHTLVHDNKPIPVLGCGCLANPILQDSTRTANLKQMR